MTSDVIQTIGVEKSIRYCIPQFFRSCKRFVILVMAKKKNNLLAKIEHESRAKFKKTSVAKRRPKFSSMNKSKKRSFKAYNRQGK